ncbi:MAG: ABC transporter permease [Acidobacteriia bacterium]|nr:ABC transporter permease [Terriglobia bacterium]
MVSVLCDFRYALRMLVRHRRITVLTIAVLALGSSGSSAVFSVVNAVLLRPFVYSTPEMIYEISGKTAKGLRSFSAGDFISWQTQTRVFAKMAAVESCTMIVEGRNEAEQVAGGSVTVDCLPLLGTAPFAGRWFVETDFTAPSRAVIIGKRLWQRCFQADPFLLGRSILLNGKEFTVVGIMPAEFQFTDRKSEFWIPLQFSSEQLSHRDWRLFKVYARANIGISAQSVEAEARRMSEAIIRQYPNEHAGWSVAIRTIGESTVGEVRSKLFLLLGAVGCVLLIACLNAVNLIFVGNAERSREIALRAALGASRSRIIRQCLIEILIIMLSAAFLGLALGSVEIQWLVTTFGGMSGVPRLEQTSIDWRVLCVTIALSFICTVAIGLLPSLHASKQDFNEILKETARNVYGGKRSRHIRGCIIIAETALSLLLMTGAGLMLRSIYNLMTVDPGFNAENLLTLKLPLPEYRISDEKQQAMYYLQILRRVQAIPGVRAAGLSTVLPLAGGDALFQIRSTADREVFSAAFRSVSPEYFDVMRIPIVKGRPFRESDTADSQRVAIVNEALAGKMWPGENPIGKIIKWGKGLPVVGVVKDVKHRSLALPTQPELYMDYLQYLGAPQSALAVRADSNPLNLVADIRRTIRSMETDQPLTEVRTMEEVIYDSLAQPRFYTSILTGFAIMAILLASIGIYGVMSFLVSQQRHEIAVRLALGARNCDIMWEYLSRGMRYVVVGIGTGWIAALALTKILANMLFEIGQTDLVTYIGACLFLLFITASAIAIPIGKAMRMELLVALREL